MEMSHDYIDAYHSYGKDILTSPAHANLKPRVVSLLPKEGFYALDIGSDNCDYADEVTKDAEAAGKKGQFVVIDLFPTDKRVIHTTAEGYVSQPHEKKFDLILMEEFIHLIPEPKEFLQNCHKILADDGAIVLFNLAMGTKVTWTESLQAGFDKSFFDEKHLEEVKDIFTIEIERELIVKQVKKDVLLGLVQFRGWSNLLKNSEEEIKEGIKVLEAQEGETLPFTLSNSTIILRKKK